MVRRSNNEPVQKALLSESTRFYIKKGLKEHILVIISYLALTIFLTFPVAFNIKTHIPGGLDAFGWIRTLWYTKIAILQPDLTSLTHDNLTFYPGGKDISAFPSAFNQLTSLVLSNFMDVHIAYTILWLASFCLGAYGTYLLVYYLTKNKFASFVSGIVFAFSPFHMLHALAGHLGAATILWIPFSALYLMKLFKEPTLKNSILAGIFFILVAMSDLQYMVFMGVFVSLLFFYEIYCILTEFHEGYLPKIFDLLKKYIPFALIAFVGLIPLAIGDIIIATSQENFLMPGSSEAITYSNDLLSFFLPSVLHPLFGNFVRPIYANFTGNVYESTAYIGYTVLLLTIIAFSRLKNGQSGKILADLCPVLLPNEPRSSASYKWEN